MVETRFRFITILLLAGIVFTVTAILFYFFIFREADRAIEDARRALEGEEPEFESRIFLVDENSAKTDQVISSPSGMSQGVIYQGRLLIPSDGGLLVLEKGAAPVAEVSKPLAERDDGGGFAPSGPDLRNRIRAERTISRDNTIYISRLLNSGDGLAENRIAGIAVVSGKVLLAHPNEGISLYSPKKIEQIRFRDDRLNHISALSSYVNGVVLATASGDILEYDGEKFLLKHTNLLENSEAEITALLATREGVFIGTNLSGFYSLSEGQLKKEGESHFSSSRVNALVSEGYSVYAATDRGIFKRVRKNQFEKVYGDSPVLSMNSKTGFTAGTYFGELLELKEGKTPVAVKIPGESKPVRGIIRAGDELGLESAGSMIICFEDALLRRSADGRFYRIARSVNLKTISANYITSFDVDTEGKLWVGYFDRGIDILSADMKLLQHLENEDIHIIRHLKYDSNRRVMKAATSRGVLEIRNDFSYDVINREDGLIHNEVSHINFTPDGELYSTAGGVTFNRSGILRSLYVFHGLGSNHVYCSANRGPLSYAGTLHGISVIKDMVVTNTYTTSDSGLPGNWVSALMVDSEGTLWAGTYGEGIARLTEENKWEPIKCPYGRLNVNNNALIMIDNYLLIGTLSNGIIIYDTGREEWSRFDDALPSSNVTAFFKKGNNILVGTDAGILIFNKNNLNQ